MTSNVLRQFIVRAVARLVQSMHHAQLIPTRRRPVFAEAICRPRPRSRH